MSRRIRTAVLISGRGSNMEALVRAARDPAYPAEITLVLSNRPDAAGLAFAKQEEIKTATVDHKTYVSRKAFEAEMHRVLEEHAIDLVCLAGFMRVLTPWFVSHWEGRLLNIHPSLLPAFPGLDTHKRALDAGVSVHGCTVHFVIPDLDAGPIIAQAQVPVVAGDDEASLAARVLAEEHVLYPKALAQVALEQVAVEQSAQTLTHL